jgi:hypothetical protein
MSGHEVRFPVDKTSLKESLHECLSPLRTLLSLLGAQVMKSINDTVRPLYLAYY